ncbi:hypothetical protein [Haloarchaeobius amylolyticus]|uniref:hypothetical protein n=1 Tax=Haloarchaeobius amylolyticus TaxID=1198296 RepID=UPI00226DBABB|nr:hypothetical protein [Haloarchaeobius amylolyticus]
MILKPDDRIQVSIIEASHRGVRGNPEEWSNIETIEVASKVPGYNLTPGSQIQSVVERIEEGVAYVTQQPGGYQRHTAPGDQIEVSIERMVADSVGESSAGSATQIERLIVPGVTPLERARVEVAKMRGDLAFGRVVETLESGLDIGDEVRAQTIKGESKVTVIDSKVTVDTGHEAKCQTEVTVRVEAIGDPSTGMITDAGDLPIEGTTVSANVTEGEERAVAKYNGFAVTLSKPALVSGTVSVRITERSNGNLFGRVSDYRGRLPSAGDSVAAKVYAHNQTASPAKGRYTIQLTSKVKQSGKATVHITGVGERISGVVEQYEEDEGDSDRVAGSKNHLLNGTSL